MGRRVIYQPYTTDELVEIFAATRWVDLIACPECSGPYGLRHACEAGCCGAYRRCDNCGRMEYME